MTSRKTSEIYDTTCHVVDSDTVIVQGSKFVRERTCRNVAEHPERWFTCSECGCDCDPLCIPDGIVHCPKCGAKAVSE